MSQPDDDDLLRLVSEAFDEDLNEPPSSLTEAAKALRPLLASPAGGGAEPTQVYRLERHLAAAAASTSRHLGATLTSADGSIVTEVSENEEAHLTVTVRSPDTSVLYVAMAWTPITADGVGRRSRLVTPLAPDRHGVGVRYDLGSVEEADAVDIEAAEAVPLAAVDPSDVEFAFALAPTGASHRAWVRAESIHRANGDPLAEVIAQALTP